MNFPKRLRELREKTGLLQEELAEKLNIPRSSIAHYESDDNLRLPRHGRLKSIAEFFGVSVDYLLGVTKEDAYYEYAPNDEIRDVLEQFEDVDSIIKQFYLKHFKEYYNNDMTRYVDDQNQLYMEMHGKTLDPLEYVGIDTPEQLFQTIDFDSKLNFLHAIVVTAKTQKLNFEEYLKQNEIYYKKKSPSGEIEDLMRQLKITLDAALRDKEFVEDSNFEPTDIIKIPIYGEIKAGYDFVGEQNITGYEYTSKKSVSDGEYYYLIVRGDSMIDDGIFEGCKVLVKKQNTVENGKIGVCIVNDEEATLKRVYYDGDKIILMAANKRIPPKTYDISEVMIQGQVKSYVVDL